jgi:hypothetical protein
MKFLIFYLSCLDRGLSSQNDRLKNVCYENNSAGLF